MWRFGSLVKLRFSMNPHDWFENILVVSGWVQRDIMN